MEKRIIDNQILVELFGNSFSDDTLLGKKLLAKKRIPVGISSCLLGDKVRYDGDDRYDGFIDKELGQFLEFRRYCPELEIGLGVPRKPIRLEKTADDIIRCVQVDDLDKDVTKALTNIARQQASVHQDLCGYIFKKGSPSCGAGNVKVWDKGVFSRTGTGIYAQALIAEFADLPIVDEETLVDEDVCEDFLQRIINRWRSMEKPCVRD